MMLALFPLPFLHLEILVGHHYCHRADLSVDCSGKHLHTVHHVVLQEQFIVMRRRMEWGEWGNEVDTKLKKARRLG